mgnify:CR=1 FL=1
MNSNLKKLSPLTLLFFIPLIPKSETVYEAIAVPTIIATLIGGLVADRINRRSVLILTSGISSALLLLLGILDACEKTDL